MERVLTVTLNPTLDITSTVDDLQPRRKLRCGVPRYEAGGGGVNVSRVIKLLGGDSCAYVGLGGGTGEVLRRLLAVDAIEATVFELQGESRITFQVINQASGDQYRFVLPGPQQDSVTEERLLAALTGFAAARDYRYVVVSGSLFPGVSHEIYARLIARLREAEAKVMLDTSGPALRAALGERPFLVKCNENEAKDAVAGDGASAASPETLAQRLVEQGGADVVVVTLGRRGAVVSTGEMGLHIPAPEVEALSTTGAGDSFMGGLVYGLANGWSLTAASCLGVAAGADAVTCEASGLCTRSGTCAKYEALAERFERFK